MAIDCKPAIFRVNLVICDHLEGYEATVEFRRVDDGPTSVSCREDTPEGALRALELTILSMFTKCPVCGEYPTHHKE
jgi:hypothetical protein